MDIGFVKGEKVKLLLKNFGDNMRAYKIKNTVMALRVSDTKNILIKWKKYSSFFLYKNNCLWYIEYIKEKVRKWKLKTSKKLELNIR